MPTILSKMRSVPVTTIIPDMSLIDLIYSKTGFVIGALMILSVIAADNRKDAGELNLLAALTEGLKMPDKVMNKAYGRYFKD